MGLRLVVLAAVSAAAALPVAGASASTNAATSWAAPEIRLVLSKGLFDAKTVTAFRPTALLTRQSLSNLAFGLKQVLAPPELTPPVEQPVPDPVATPTPVDPSAPTDPAAPADPAAPVDPNAPATPTDPTTTAPDPTATTPVPVPAPPAAPEPTSPPKVADPAHAVTITGLDSQLVSSLGLGRAAGAFARGAKAAGLTVPNRFGTEVVARLLGLRIDHPAAQDFLELLPGDPATRAEAAYSAAKILGFGWLGNSWETAAVSSLASDFSLPEYTPWQRRILDAAVARIGMPYVWGGTSDGPEAPFGIHAPGGYDCSGFVWRVYKLTGYPDEGSLASTLRGRTTYVMSVEVPRSQRIPFAKLQPADVIFFGNGPNSSSAEIDHMGIYLGNGWFIHSSGYGVALARLDGWYRRGFAWGRRPLHEAGLE